MSSSTRDTLICDNNQSACIWLKIPVACLVLLGMICISRPTLSHFGMYVYCSLFDRIYICIYYSKYRLILQLLFRFMLGVDMVD